jgi:hypothetical protein
MALFKLKRRQLFNILLFLQILCTFQSGTQIDTRWEHCLRKQIKWESTNNFSVFVPYLDLQIKKLDLTRDEKNKKVWAFCLTRFSKLGVQNPRFRTDKVTFSKEEEKHFLKRRNRKRTRKKKSARFSDQRAWAALSMFTEELYKCSKIRFDIKYKLFGQCTFWGI